MARPILERPAPQKYERDQNANNGNEVALPGALIRFHSFWTIPTAISVGFN
jgi:hypothetical protein